MYYDNLENLTFFLLLTFRRLAYQPTATAETTPQSTCFSYKCTLGKKKNSICHRSHLLLLYLNKGYKLAVLHQTAFLENHSFLLLDLRHNRR